LSQKGHVIDDCFAQHPDKLVKYQEKIREGQVQTAFTRPSANTIVSLPNIDQLLKQKIIECLLKQFISQSTTTNQPVFAVSTNSEGIYAPDD